MLVYKRFLQILKSLPFAKNTCKRWTPSTTSSPMLPYSMHHALKNLDTTNHSGEKTSSFANMFSSHPDTVKRINHIKEMAMKDGHALED